MVIANQIICFELKSQSPESYWELHVLSVSPDFPLTLCTGHWMWPEVCKHFIASARLGNFFG